MVIGLAPMLWASGVGAEIIRPMAAPVLGGILVADEVIDLFLPVLFYWVRRWRWERMRAGEVANGLSPDPESSILLLMSRYSRTRSALTEKRMAE